MGDDEPKPCLEEGKRSNGGFKWTRRRVLWRLGFSYMLHFSIVEKGLLAEPSREDK